VHDTFTGIKIRHAENQKIKKPNKFEKNLWAIKPFPFLSE
jgi:hypothetical protein